MKFPFFKAILVASAIFTLVSCGEDSPSKSSDIEVPSQALVVDQPSWVFTQKDKQYVIGVDLTVKDANGATVGTFDPASGSIVAKSGSVIAANIDIGTLPVIQPPVINSTAWILTADQVYVIYPATPGAVDASGNFVGIVTDAAGKQVGMFLYDAGLVGNIVAMDGTTPIVSGVNAAELKVYESNPKKEEPSSSSIAQKPTSSSSTPKSSSSSAKSSSSSAKSSSSQGSGGTTSNYVIKYVNGGKSGEGYATRYWDCCKPHCAWPEHGGKAHTCDASGNRVDNGASSMCDGGNAGICRNQFPIVVNDTLAFAFAATPGGENNCGKCFDLVFTGKGKYSDANQSKIKGKHLIVMSSNVGYDVAGGQFDVMIPGGGYGIFNGCASKMGWGSQGSQYGGLLDECEKETNYTASKYKSCLTEKCNKSFSNDAQAKEGCLFLANWMNAAGNPLHKYKEVECPKELSDRF